MARQGLSKKRPRCSSQRGRRVLETRASRPAQGDLNGYPSTAHVGQVERRTRRDFATALLPVDHPAERPRAQV